MWWWECDSNHEPHRSHKATLWQIHFGSQWPDFCSFSIFHLQLLTVTAYHLCILSTIYHLCLPSPSTVYHLPESPFAHIEHNHNRFSKGWTIFGETPWGKLVNTQQATKVPVPITASTVPTAPTANTITTMNFPCLPVELKKWWKLEANHAADMPRVWLQL